MKFLFWLIAGALLTVATHISYILFVPPSHFSAGVNSILKDNRENSFIILNPDQQTRLLPFTTAQDLVGFCKFNVSDSQVRFAMEVPEGYWTFSVYTMRGQEVYALNDKQADTTRFNITLSKSVSLLDQITDSATLENDVMTDLGWRVSVTDPQGVAFLWMPHGDALRRKEAMQALVKSTCTTVQGQ